MMKKTFKLLKPIFRPNSFQEKERNITKLWLDKNENSDNEINKFYKKKFLNKIPSRYIFSYPSLAETYSKISKYTNLRKNQILLTSGSDSGIKIIFESIVKKNDKVMILSPTFEMYEVYCKLFQSNYKKIQYSLKDKKIYLEMDKFLKTIKTFKPKLLCFASPDSPTGFSFKEKDVNTILNFSKKNNIFILIDEAYFLFNNKTLIKKINSFDNLAIVRSMVMSSRLVQEVM